MDDSRQGLSPRSNFAAQKDTAAHFRPEVTQSPESNHHGIGVRQLVGWFGPLGKETVKSPSPKRSRVLTFGGRTGPAPAKWPSEPSERLRELFANLVSVDPSSVGAQNLKRGWGGMTD